MCFKEHDFELGFNARYFTEYKYLVQTRKIHSKFKQKKVFQKRHRK